MVSGTGLFKYCPISSLLNWWFAFCSHDWSHVSIVECQCTVWPRMYKIECGSHVRGSSNIPICMVCGCAGRLVVVKAGMRLQRAAKAPTTTVVLHSMYSTRDLLPIVSTHNQLPVGHRLPIDHPIMAHLLRGKQAGIQGDLSANVLPEFFAVDDVSRGPQSTLLQSTHNSLPR